jgi:hypothetical protein
MKNEEKQSGEKTDAMNKQQEMMPDGKRYIIYYTFGENGEEIKCGGEAEAAASETSTPESVEKEVKTDV